MNELFYIIFGVVGTVAQVIAFALEPPQRATGPSQGALRGFTGSPAQPNSLMEDVYPAFTLGS
ncbi:MAG: hypothetical protein WCI11_12700 [Candidatus Methylumidiphilus sp.]